MTAKTGLLQSPSDGGYLAAGTGSLRPELATGRSGAGAGTSFAIKKRYPQSSNRASWSTLRNGYQLFKHLLTNLQKRHRARSRWGGYLALAFALQAFPAHAAFLEGEAVYRERIMPPPDAVLVISLQDTSRADAPATELASIKIHLAGGPPYRWRLEYDERTTGAPARPVLRGRIETPAGLWMTTDTVMPAFTPAPVLQLRSVAMTPDPCASASAQAALNECAYESFLAASAVMSPQLRQIESALTPSRRTAWRNVQKAWLTFRTQSCQFESGAVQGGSAGPMVQWQCAARMTRERTAALARLASCPEGDIACVPHSIPKGAP